MGKSIAWMLRRDGKAIQVPVHAYGDEEDSEYVLMNAEWLYDNTNSTETKNDVISLLAIYAVNNDCIDVSTFANYAIEHDYLQIKVKFLEKIYNELEKAINDVINSDFHNEEYYNKKVIDDLNQEFCRVRAGGLYDSDGSLGDIYFRTSSTRFNWFDVIWQFVYDRRKNISTVTIVRDKESTSEDNVYYNKMPVDEFITLSGHPYIENMDRRN